MPKHDQVIVDIKNYVFHHVIDSPQAWQAARLALLDSMGCAIQTAALSADCRRLLGPVVPRTMTPCGFRLPGTDHILDPIKGSFDMATLIRYLDHNDAIAGADWGHPSDNLGSILAVSDWLCRSVRNGTIEHKGPPLTMKTLWIALIKAYEIQGCMLLQNAFHKHGIDHVILVKLASTAVVSWLLGLSEWQTMDAVSQVWMDGQPLRVYRQGGNTIPRKGWAAGDACMKATHLALLTRAGQPGALTPLSMPRWGFYDASFKGQAFELPRNYGSWVVENTIFKVMPVEGHAISSVEAALQHLSAMRAKGLENPVSDIKSILIRTNSATDTIINKQGPLHNAADRDHCLQYIVSLAFLKGSPPEVADYQNNSSWARSIALSRLREKIHVRADERLTQAYLDPEVKSLAAGMEVHLDNGTVLSEIVIDFPIGHSKNANTQTVVRHKARKNLKLMFPAEHVVHLEAAVGDESMAISDFMDMFVPPQSSSRL